MNGKFLRDLDKNEDIDELTTRYEAIRDDALEKAVAINDDESYKKIPYVINLSAEKCDVDVLDATIAPCKSKVSVDSNDPNDFSPLGRFSNLDKFNKILKKRAYKAYDYYHQCTFGDFLLSRIDRNYILSDAKTGRICSVLVDHAYWYQEGDCKTHYFQHDNNLFIWNDGDVFSVVHINITLKE